MSCASIRPGRPEDLPHIRRLQRSGARRFTYAAFGADEEPDLLRGPNAVIAERQTQRIAGFLSFAPAARSDALPAHAPSKVTLRAVALSSAEPPAVARFGALFECAQQQLPPRPQGHLFYVLTDQHWLQACLKEAGFSLHDAICFYERTSRSVQPAPQPARLRRAKQTDLPRLARVDATAFDPLWHMGAAELLTLARHCRIEIAEIEREAVGYTALQLSPAQSPSRYGSAQLARLTVHPQAQDRGIGRQLLVDSLSFAHQLGIHRVFLNTQESNSLSRKLYESLQFRKRGRAVPVFVKRVTHGGPSLFPPRRFFAGSPC